MIRGDEALDSADEAFRWELNDVACWDEASCVAVGTAGRILVTVDGGDGREQVSEGGGGFAAVACSGPERCMAVGDGGRAAESVDAARTWADLELAGTPTLRDVACPSADRCVAVGDENVALEIRADGTSEALRDVGNASSDLLVIRCHTATVCHGLIGSGSRGTSVRRVDLDPAAARIASTEIVGGSALPFEGTDLTCPAPGACMTVGLDPDADVATTIGDEGGWRSLPAIPAPIAEQRWLVALDCADLATCAAATNDGRIVRTDDGGLFWYVVPAETEYEMQPEALRCPTAETCFLSASGGGVRRMRATGARRAWRPQGELRSTDPTLRTGIAVERAGARGVTLGRAFSRTTAESPRG